MRDAPAILHIVTGISCVRARGHWPRPGGIRESRSEGSDAGLQGDDRQRRRRASMAAPRLRRSSSALQPRLSGRGEHPGMARPGAGGRLRGRLAEVHGGEPAARHPRPRVLSPLRKRLQSAVSRSGGFDPFARPIPRRSRERQGLDDRAGAADRQAGARGRRRPGGPVVRVPLATPRARRRNPRCQPRAGRHDALRDSRVPPAARGSSTRRSRASRRWG